MAPVAPHTVSPMELEEDDGPIERRQAPAFLAVDAVGQELAERHVQDQLDLVGAGRERRAPGQGAHERHDERAAGHGLEVVQLAHRGHQGGVQTDLLLGLPQGRGPQVGVCRVMAAAGEAHLAPVRAEVLGPPGQHDEHLTVVLVERGQHGRGAHLRSLQARAAGPGVLLHGLPDLLQ